MDREKGDNPFEGIGFGDFGTYFRNKKIKLQLQQDEIAALAEDDLPQIFEGVIVYVNGYTNPPIHEIRNMIVQRGGEFRQFLSKSRITHIIASNLTQSKMKENYKVAKPEWVTESVKANRLLPWHNFSTIRIPGSLTTFGSSSQATQSRTSSFSSASGLGKAGPAGGTTPFQTQALHKLHTEHTDTPQPSHSHTHTHTHIPGNEPAPSLDDTEMEDITELGEPDATQEIPEAEIEAALEDMEDEDSFFENLDLEQFEYQPTPPTVDPPPDQQPGGDIPTSPEPFTQEMNSAPPLPQQPPAEPRSPTESKPDYSRIAFNPYSRAGLPGMMPVPESNNTMKQSEVLGTQIETDPQDHRHPTLIELSVPWNRQNSSVQPGFVEKFYQSSRLHYLSTWKAKLRDITTKIQKDRPPTVTKSVHKTILHVDFDCFFASVATRGKPELQVKPIAVAHGTGGSTSNSEIASCNYLARDFGVKNGMQLLRARTLCPELVVVPYEFQQYEDISIEFYKILLSYADELQAVSVDEALVDITSKCLPSWGAGPNGSQFSACGTPDAYPFRVSPAAFALKVREEIFLATGCHASVGIGPNILLAKLSTKRAKPHGQYIWPSAPGSNRTLEELQGAVPNLIEEPEEDPSSPGSANASYSQSYEPPPVVRKSVSRNESVVKDLPGVGYKISQDLLERLNVRTLHELQQAKRDELQRICGMKTGDLLYNSCRGIDDTTIASDREKARQSVSAEISWGVRFENHQQVDTFMRDLAQEVSKRLKEIDRKGKSIVMKIMKRKEFVKGAWKHLGHGPVDQFARTGQLPLYTDDPDLIANEALKLLAYFKFDVLDLRGLGIQVLKLNNDIVNTVSKSAFTLQDTMNQTTLTSAMFQQKRNHQPPKEALDAVNTRRPLDNDDVLEQEPPHPQPQPPAERQPEPEKPTMEIDSDTFKELPKDIQDELLRHHKLVFLHQEIPHAATIRAEVRIHAAEESASTDHPPNRQHELPPWSQLDPVELMALSTPVIRDALKEYAEMGQSGQGQSCRQPTTATARRPSITATARRLSTTMAASPPRRRLEADDDILGNSVLPAPSKVSSDRMNLLDRSVLQELPPEIRAEIEQEYTHIMENYELIRKLAQPGSSGSSGGGGTAAGTSTGYQLRASELTTAHDHIPDQGSSRSRGRGGSRGAPRGRPRGSRGRGRGRGQVHIADYSERANDVCHKDDGHHRGSTTAQAPKTASMPSEVPELDANFLAALPKDIRAEVEAQHRLEVIKSRRRQEDELAAQRDTAAASRQGSGTSGNQGPQGSILERPTLMEKREIGDLRVLLAQWVNSTLVEQCPAAGGDQADTLYDEGPNPDDVQSFVDFVARVIVMERDLERVRLLLRYLRRRIGDNERQVKPATESGLQPKQLLLGSMTWRQALQRVVHVTRQLVAQLYGGSFDID
ncbi:deoxycytidyl transferase [Mortierella sp. NVP41]|nr:deoxycytidyl transferase [Mortierella sp. NVP41]